MAAAEEHSQEAPWEVVKMGEFLTVAGHNHGPKRCFPPW